MASRVIWERTVDHHKIAERQRRFQQRFLIPAGILLLVVLVFAGWQNAIGVAIVLVGVGLMWRNVVKYQSLSDQANPTIVVEHGRLKVGEREVIIEDVKRFTTIATSLQTSLLGRYSQIPLGKAIFRMDNPSPGREPELVEFGWPNMTAAGVAEIKAALMPELNGKWVEPVDLLEEAEHIAHKRRPGIRRRQR